MSTEDYEETKDVFTCIVHLAECLKLSCLPVTEENIDSVEVLKNAVSICKLLDPNNDEILGRNIKRIVDPLESLITGRFLEL